MDKGHEMTDKRLEKLEAKIRKEYKGAKKTVSDRLKEYLKTFKEEDAAQLKMLSDGKITEEAYRRWRATRMLTGNKWKDTLAVLTKDMVNADKIAASLINGELPTVYAMNANYGTYEIESGLGINTSFTLYDERTVEKLLSKNPDLIPAVKPDIPKDMRWNRKKITSAVTQGVLAGDSIPDIAKRLRAVTDMDENAAIRNARTYTTAAESGGRIEAYRRAEEMGIDVEKEWMSTLDRRTRHSHRAMNGERAPIDGTFSNGLERPGDLSGPPEEIYNCRCRIVAALKGYDYSNSERFSRLPEDMSYEEWEKGGSGGKR